MDTYIPPVGQPDGVREDVLGSSLYAGSLLGVVGALAWVTGRPFVFPSLGPSAYMLATVRSGQRVSGRRVVGGHLVGVLAGLLAYHALAPGLVVTAESPALATAQLRLAASGVCGVALTTAGMRAADATHPPACATTLIVSLGLLSAPVEAAVVLLGVVALVGAHRAAERIR